MSRAKQVLYGGYHVRGIKIALIVKQCHSSEPSAQWAGEAMHENQTEGKRMHYEVITGLTPRAVFEHAIVHFGPRGAGLQLALHTSHNLVFQGGGRHVVLTVKPGPQTILALETHTWDEAVQQFMAQVSRRRWWSRWWRRRKPAGSLPLMFPMLHAEGESSEPRDAQRVLE